MSEREEAYRVAEQELEDAWSIYLLTTRTESMADRRDSSWRTVLRAVKRYYDARDSLERESVQ